MPEASQAVVESLTSGLGCSARRGAGRSSPLTKRVARGGLKVDAI
jgi:hypothetical protein